MNKDAVAEMSQQYQVEAVEKVVPEGYKQTEVGVIPEDWEACLASDVMSFFAGYSFSSKSAQSSGVKWLKIANVGLNEVKWDAESYLPYEFSKKYEDYLLKPQDIVIALTRPLLGRSLKIAKLELEDSPALLNQRVARLDSLDENNKEFMYYIVQRLEFISAMNLAMAGTDPPNIGVKALGRIFVPVPPSKEQAAIASVLSDISALLSELEKLIAKKQAIKTATMQQLLTGRTRLPQFAHHPDGSKKGYKQSELGEIPEDWEVMGFDDVAARINTKKNQISTSDYQNYGSYPVVDQGKKKIVGYSDLECKVFKVSDAGVIVFGDHTCIVKYVGFSFLVGADGVQVISGREGCNTRFLSYVMSFFPVEPTGYNRHYGALKEFIYSLPKQDEQTAIATILADMDEEIQALEHRLTKTRQIKQGMMQELLTGKTRLMKGEENV